MALIILCGEQKSEVGKLLAQKVGKPFIESSRILSGVQEKFQNSSETIQDIQNHFGDNYSKAMEKHLLFSLQILKEAVVTIEKGLLTSENTKILKESGTIIYLKSSSDEKPHLESVADFIVNTEGKNPDELAQQIIEKVASQ